MHSKLYGLSLLMTGIPYMTYTTVCSERIVNFEFVLLYVTVLLCVLDYLVFGITLPISADITLGLTKNVKDTMQTRKACIDYLHQKPKFFQSLRL